MAHINPNRVGEMSTSVGTVPFALTPAVAMRRFGTVMGVGDTCWYLAVAVDAVSGAPTGPFEYGKGTYIGPNLLERTTPRGSSNDDALVNFGVGPKLVITTLLAPDDFSRDDWLKLLGLGAQSVVATPEMAVPSGAGENGTPVPLLRYLHRSISSIDFSEQRYDKDGNSFGNNVNTVQDWPLKNDFGTLEAAELVFAKGLTLDDQRDWAEVRAAIDVGADARLPSDADGRIVNINRPIYCNADYTQFLNRRCRIYTGQMPEQAIVDGDAPQTDSTYPDASIDSLGPASGAVFVFTDTAIEPVFEGLEFDGVRFAIVFMAGAINPVFRNIRAHRSNCMVFCYSGDIVNPTFENCGGDELGALLISSATAYPADHPETGSATNATYGLTAIASEFTPTTYADFNTWFRNSIMRPAAQSVTASGSSIYSGNDQNATGRKVFIPRRNIQATALTWAALSGGRLTTNALVQAGANDPIDWGALSGVPAPAPPAPSPPAPAPAPAPSPTPAPPPAPSAKTAYLLNMTEDEMFSFPAKLTNAVSGGGTFSNVANGGALGGQIGGGAPFGRGLWAHPEADNASPVAIISDQTYTGLRTIELFVIKLESNQPDGPRSLTRWYINSTDYIDFQVRAGGSNYYIAAILQVGATATDLFITDEVPPIAVAGKDAAFHFAPQHENDGSVTLRGNGKLLGTSDELFPAPFVGFVDPFGSYDRTAQISRGMYHAETSNLRGSFVLRYSGTDYPVPTEPFVLD